MPRRLEDIDTLRLSLTEIQKRAYQLRKFNKSDSESNPYTKAHYLLIGKGLTIEEIESELKDLKTLTRNSEFKRKSIEINLQLIQIFQYKIQII